MKMRNVLRGFIAAAMMAVMGCDFVEGIGEDPVERIARDNSETARVLREAFRNGTFDDALASVMEDSLVAEEVFSIVHGHPLLRGEENLAAIEQLTPTEQLRLLTAPATRQATRHARTKAPTREDQTPVTSAPGEAELDETIRYFLRLERGENAEPPSTVGSERTVQEPATASSSQPTEGSAPRDTTVPDTRGYRAGDMPDTSPGTRAVERRNDRVRAP